MLHVGLGLAVHERCNAKSYLSPAHARQLPQNKSFSPILTGYIIARVSTAPNSFTPDNAGTPEIATSDEQALQRFGYRQELNRTLGYFSSFALSFSVICITSGLFANYGDGLRTGGPAFIWTWLIVGAGQFLVALVFAQLARRIPLSGYAYQWTRELSGQKLALWAGWMMIVQFVTGMAGVAYALASYVVPFLGFANSSRNIVIATVATLLLAALINHFGIRLASVVNDFSVIAEILGTVVIGFLLLGIALLHKVHPIGYLFSHPAQPGGMAYLGAFLASSLMSVWTLGGFEAAANVAEETHLPEKRIPTAILLSEVIAVLLGMAVLIGFTLAIPSLDVASHNATPLLYIIGSYFPGYVVVASLALVSIAIFACVLANLTTLTRLVWAMARDNQLPASRFLAKVSVHKVPANAIWVVIPITAVFTIWAQVEVVIMAICTFAMYVTYGMVVGAVLWGNKHKSDLQATSGLATLCIAALVWLASITGLLVFMTARAMSRVVLLETAAAAALLAAILAFYLFLRWKNRRSAVAVEPSASTPSL
jgi:amino acid transporter